MSRKSKSFQLAGRHVLWILTIMVASCDPFQEDQVQPVIFGQTEYFTLPGKSVVIDLRTVIKESFVNVTVEISHKPANGQLSNLDVLILRYRPLSTFVEGDDEFQLSVVKNGKVIGTQTITIHLKQTPEDFACSVYAMEDLVGAKPDSTISIRLLNNDLFCGIDESKLITSLHTNPAHGDATISGGVLHYKANTEYRGWDQFVYKIAGENDVVSYGLIRIVVAEESIQIGKDSQPVDIRIELKWQPANAADIDIALAAYKIDFDETITLKEISHSSHTGSTFESIDSWLIEDGDYQLQIRWQSTEPVSDGSNWTLSFVTVEGVLNCPYNWEDLVPDINGSEKKMSATYDSFQDSTSTPGVGVLYLTKSGPIIYLNF